jgi:hypothetical protein
MPLVRALVVIEHCRRPLRLGSRGVVALGACCLLRCSTFTYYAEYYVSAPQALPANVLGKTHGSGLTELMLGDLELRLIALDTTPPDGWNASTWRQQRDIPHWYERAPVRIPRLMIEFEFKPPKAGFSFNPMKVAVKASDGSVLTPLSYVGPGEVAFTRNFSHQAPVPEESCLRRTGGWGAHKLGAQLPRRTDATDLALPLKRTCFVVAFDTNVVPPTSVELHVDGIAEGSTVIPGPSLTLARRKASTFGLKVMPTNLP